MIDLEDHLRQRAVRKEALQLLWEMGRRVVFLEGPSGSGKSWLGRSIGKVWAGSTGAVLIAEGDISCADDPFKPFEKLEGVRFDVKNVAVKGVRTALDVGGRFLGLGAAGGSIFDLLSEVTSPLYSRWKNLLTDEELGYVAKLRRLSSGTPVFLIADNLHWWDGRSLHFLKKLATPNLWDEHGFLSQLRILAVETVDQTQETICPELIETWKRQQEITPLKLTSCDVDAFKAALEKFGIRTALPQAVIEDLHRICGANLKLAELIADYVDANGQVVDLTESQSSHDFLRNLLVVRFRFLGKKADLMTNILQSASIIGLLFSRKEILCLLNDRGNTDSILRALHSAHDAKLICLQNGAVSFTHPVVRDFFLREISEIERALLSEKLAECVRKLRPSDYLGHSLLLDKAGQTNAALTSLAHAYLVAKRQRRPVEDVLTSRQKGRIENGRYGHFCTVLGVSYDLVARGAFEEALATSAYLPEPVEMSLFLELLYLRALCTMELQSEKSAGDAARMIEDTLEGAEWVKKHKELVMRLRLLQQQALVLAGEVEEARGNSMAMATRLRDEAENDSDAEVKLHQLLRKSNSVNEPFTAHVHALQALNYFKPSTDDGFPEHPTEYYRTLTNLGGILIQLGRYEEAYGTLKKAERLFFTMPEFPFPRQDIPLNNLVIAGSRSNRTDMETCVIRQRLICGHPDGRADNFQQRNNLLGYLLLSHIWDESEALIAELLAEVKVRGISESYLVLYLFSHRLALSVIRADWTGALTANELLKGTLAKIQWPSRPSLVRRQDMIEQILRDRPALNPEEYDLFFIERDPMGSGHTWPHFGRGILLSELQFWSDV